MLSCMRPGTATWYELQWMLFYRQLPNDLFGRIHRSVVVAADHVDSIGRGYVTLSGVPDHMFRYQMIFIRSY